MSAVIVTDLTVFKDSVIAIGFNSQTAPEFIEFIEIQEFELLNKLFGNVFANDLLSNISAERYTNLINNKTYLYSNYTYKKRGLKRMLELLIFVKYTTDIQVRVGSSGMYELTQEANTVASTALIIQKQTNVLREARTIFLEIKDYIDRNWSDYEAAPPEFANFTLINTMF